MDLAKIKEFIISKIIVVLTFFFLGVIKCHDVWEEDLSKDMTIGLADGGYEKVELRCAADSMQVDVVTDDDFSGVIYTRGSFHRKQLPCFLDPGETIGNTFSMNIPFDKCQTLNEGEVYSNVLVVQNDKDLIMPGDAAFNLECDFSQPRDVQVEANMQTQKAGPSSRISLVDADPAAGSVEKKERLTVESYYEVVKLTPEDIKAIRSKQKDEL